MSTGPEDLESAQDQVASRDAAADEFVDALLDDDAEQLYDRAPCGYLSTTPDGTIIKVNQTFLTLTGLLRQDLVGRRRFVDLLTGGGRIYHETHYAPLLRMQGTAREIALDVVCADGRRLPVLVNAVMERHPSGEPKVVRAAVFDASERRKYERALLRAKERAEASEHQAVRLAQTLQQTLIPPVAPAVPGLQVAAAFRPAGSGAEIGGDFYDVFQVAEDDWVATLGDVCGKGPDAAVVTALLRHTVRAAAVISPDPAATMMVANEVLRRDDTDRFCTALVMRLLSRAGSWTATVCAAGHPLPLLLTATGDVHEVGVPGQLLGVLPVIEVETSVVRMEHGDRLLLFTDGVTEARRDDAEYGAERLSGLVAGSGGGVAELVEAVLADVMAFQRGVPRDDIAMLAISPA